MQKSSLRQSLDIFSCSIRFQSLPIHLKLWPGHIFIVVSAGKNNRKGQKQENQEKPWSPCHHFLPPSLSPAFCCWVIPALPSHPSHPYFQGLKACYHQGGKLAHPSLQPALGIWDVCSFHILPNDCCQQPHAGRGNGCRVHPAPGLRLCPGQGLSSPSCQQSFTALDSSSGESQTPHSNTGCGQDWL